MLFKYFTAHVHNQPGSQVRRTAKSENSQEEIWEQYIALLLLTRFF